MIKRHYVGAPEEIKQISGDVFIHASEQIPQQRLMLAVQLDEVVDVNGPLGEAEDGDDLVELVKIQAEEIATGRRAGRHRSSPQFRLSAKTKLLLDLTLSSIANVVRRPFIVVCRATILFREMHTEFILVSVN